MHHTFILMLSIIIHVRCDHHHPCMLRSYIFVAHGSMARLFLAIFGHVWPSGHRATCNKNGQVGYPWKVEPRGSPKLPVGTYFVPRRQHTVEVLTQNWLYCTFQRSPAISICWSSEKDFLKYNFQICWSFEKILSQKVMTLWFVCCHLGERAIMPDWFSKKT